MTGDRLANASLKQNMQLLEKLCGAKKVWTNVVTIITKQDFNPMNQNREEWEESLIEVE